MQSKVLSIHFCHDVRCCEGYRASCHSLFRIEIATGQHLQHTFALNLSLPFAKRKFSV